MADPSKRLFNKIDHMKTRVETLYDELKELCPYELASGGKPADPGDELEYRWSTARRDLGNAMVSLVELADGLDPNPPEFDEETSEELVDS